MHRGTAETLQESVTYLEEKLLDLKQFEPLDADDSTQEAYSDILEDIREELTSYLPTLIHSIREAEQPKEVARNIKGYIRAKDLAYILVFDNSDYTQELFDELTYYKKEGAL